MKSEYICNLIIPGAAKSGTSSLHAALTAHPQICGSNPKEPQFFSFPERYALGPDHHNAYFSCDGSAKYYCEGSQCYFVHEDAIKRIAESLDNPQIIIMLRDPVDRLLSQYAWNFKRGAEKASLAEAIKERGEATDYIFEDRINMYQEVGGLLAFSRYARWVPLWVREFGEDNVLVLRSEDFYKDQAKVLARCFEFLQLPPLSSAVEEVRKNRTDDTTISFIPTTFRKAAKLVPAKWKNSSGYTAFRKRVLRLLTPTPPDEISLEMRRDLEARLAKDREFYESLPSVLSS